MPKGRKPKPLTEHIKNGTFRKDRHDKRIVSADPLVAAPSMPDYMPKDCRADWQLVCGILMAHGILCENDLHTIESYCVLRYQYRQALKAIETEGLEIEETNGNGMMARKANPNWKTMMEAQREVRAIQDRLGFNPYTRQKLTLSKNEETPDPFADISNAKLN